MGFIRGSIVLILSIMLFFTLFIGNLFLTFNWSLSYENVHPYLENVTNKIVEQNNLKLKLLDSYDQMKINCITYNEFNYSIEKINTTIPCNIINIGPEETINYTIKNLPNNIYYNKYNCEYFNCLKNENKAAFLLSDFSKQYWKDNFNKILFSSIIIFIFLIIFSRDKHTPFVISGIFMIITSFLFKKINWLISLIPNFIPSELIAIFFKESYNVFITMSIIGFISIIFGASFAFFKWGIKISNLFNKIIKKEKEKINEKDVKKIVKEEVKKINKKESLTQKIKNLVKKEIKKNKK